MYDNRMRNERPGQENVFNKECFIPKIICVGRGNQDKPFMN